MALVGRTVLYLANGSKAFPKERLEVFAAGRVLQLDNFRKLVSGQVDLVPLTAREVQPLCKEAAVDCTQLERVLTLHEASTGLYMAYSRQTPPEVVERMKLRGPGAAGRLHVIEVPGCGHAPALNTPAQFALVERFLAGR